MVKTIDLDTATFSIEQLLEQLTPETEIVLTRGDVPVARITTAGNGSPKPRVLGLHAGQGWMSDDFTDELPDTFWLGQAE